MQPPFRFQRSTTRMWQRSTAKRASKTLGLSAAAAAARSTSLSSPSSNFDEIDSTGMIATSLKSSSDEQEGGNVAQGSSSAFQTTGHEAAGGPDDKEKGGRPATSDCVGYV
mmetsp:Transcript_61627/g.123576  ORF Transcript_61627/g.123576 Transcript_61627/m.123576 type:complete len:111 (+) Transcript_61627:246-578(+)